MPRPLRTGKPESRSRYPMRAFLRRRNVAWAEWSKPMQPKNGALWLGAALVLASVACGPVTPVLGLGPPLDPLAGLIMFAALVLGLGWAVKSVWKRPVRQSIDREFSKTGQAGHPSGGAVL